MKRTIALIFIGLLVLSASLAAAQTFTVSQNEIFKVHVSVYKPAGISFPSQGARLMAFLYKPTQPEWTCYNVGGWYANVETLNWDNAERQENFSLTIQVAEDAPAGVFTTLRARVMLDDNSVWDGSGVAVTMKAVEVNGENIPINKQGTPSWNTKHSMYTADAAITEVLIASAKGAYSTVIIVGLVVVIIVLLVVITTLASKKMAGGGQPSPEPLEMPHD